MDNLNENFLDMMNKKKEEEKRQKKINQAVEGHLRTKEKQGNEVRAAQLKDRKRNQTVFVKHPDQDKKRNKYYKEHKVTKSIKKKIGRISVTLIFISVMAFIIASKMLEALTGPIHNPEVTKAGGIIGPEQVFENGSRTTIYENLEFALKDIDYCYDDVELESQLKTGEYAEGLAVAKSNYPFISIIPWETKNNPNSYQVTYYKEKHEKWQKEQEEKQNQNDDLVHNKNSYNKPNRISPQDQYKRKSI